MDFDRAPLAKFDRSSGLGFVPFLGFGPGPLPVPRHGLGTLGSIRDTTWTWSQPLPRTKHPRTDLVLGRTSSAQAWPFLVGRCEGRSRLPQVFLFVFAHYRIPGITQLPFLPPGTLLIELPVYVCGFDSCFQSGSITRLGFGLGPSVGT